MNTRRQSLALLLALAASSVAQAQPADDTVVKSGAILEALNPKDIVLDRPGSPASPTPRRDPAISLQVQFTFGSSELLPQGKRQLDELAMALNDRALLTAAFELAGHTDAVGDMESNLRLSLDRANAVRAYLVQVYGLNPARLQAIGLGFTRLADPGNPTAAVNRRVEVRRLRGSIAAPVARPVEMPQQPGGRLVPTPR
jgi:outer membrane protein OmpA-like peptidoglycan-associated protein